MERKDSQIIYIRRQWNDWRIAEIELDAIKNLRWDNISGGVQTISPQFFIHGYIWCNDIKRSDFPHSCAHGKGPHRIKVCIVKRDNSPEVFNELLKIVGPKPK